MFGMFYFVIQKEIVCITMCENWLPFLNKGQLINSLIKLHTAIIFGTPLSTNDSITQNKQRARHDSGACCFSITVLHLQVNLLPC